ncbi:S8 family peptidase [Streptomyces sp. MI02-7b]|uniref:S8 family peptidase n=1 Tax=Streptomyces sp. MI02-7b TaxID=462941 RepID=UPI0029AFE716|nr:S8 family peptidase [Streptomyces sp. MI02-7b]MDX3071788.1 S8 family peptidase [Streptomyces sp. MI02-7b]
MRISPRRLAAVAAALTAVLAAPAGTSGAAAPPPVPAPLRMASEGGIAGQYLVTLAAGTDPRSVVREVGAAPMFTFTSALLGFAARLTDRQVSELRTVPGVRAVEQDAVVTVPRPQAVAAASDEVSWGLARINHREAGAAGFSVRATGADVTSYIIDTGIDFAHEEFGGRAVPGYDVVGDGQQGADCNGHGTHVAGTVGGAHSGVARGTRLVSVRVLGCDGSGSIASVVAGVNWVAEHAVKPAVANLSVGGPHTEASERAVEGLAAAGVFPVVAAGNGDTDACGTSPAGAPDAFTVAAADESDRKAEFSNWGPCVDINAPGTNITSAARGGGFARMSGTSMAAPHVTGVAALYKDTHGDVSTAALAAWLTANATPDVPALLPAGTPRLMLYTGGL